MSEIQRPEPPAWNLTGKKYIVAAALHISLMDAYAAEMEARIAELEEQWPWAVAGEWEAKLNDRDKRIAELEADVARLTEERDKARMIVTEWADAYDHTTPIDVPLCGLYRQSRDISAPGPHDGEADHE